MTGEPPMRLSKIILLSSFIVGITLTNPSFSQSKIEPNQKSVVIIQNQDDKLIKPDLPNTQYVPTQPEKGTLQKFEDMKWYEKKWVLVTIGMVTLLVFGIGKYLITGKQ